MAAPFVIVWSNDISTPIQVPVKGVKEFLSFYQYNFRNTVQINDEIPVTFLHLTNSVILLTKSSKCFWQRKNNLSFVKSCQKSLQ